MIHFKEPEPIFLPETFEAVSLQSSVNARIKSLPAHLDLVVSLITSACSWVREIVSENCDTNQPSADSAARTDFDVVLSNNFIMV